MAIQKGGLNNLTGDRVAWLLAYHQVMLHEYRSIAPHLPAACRSLLDVGGGIGGIDVMINKHYGGDVNVEILDGHDDDAVVVLARRTFNSMRVTKDFQNANGVKFFSGISPIDAVPGNKHRCDLIVSTGSWCFHFAPEVYLDYVESRCHKDTVLILDVRKRQGGWLAKLAKTFKLEASIDMAQKYTRHVFKVR